MVDIPSTAASFDVVSVVNCFHEMPDSAMSAQDGSRDCSRAKARRSLCAHGRGAVLRRHVGGTVSQAEFDGTFSEPLIKDWLH